MSNFINGALTFFLKAIMIYVWNRYGFIRTKNHLIFACQFFYARFFILEQIPKCEFLPISSI